MAESDEQDTTKAESTPAAEQSLEAQRSRLVQEVERLNESLSGHFATKIPLEEGGAVQIFNAQPIEGLEPSRKIAAAGVHPENGPIIITTGAIGDEVRNYISGKNLELPTWGRLLIKVRAENEFGGRPFGELRTIQPSEQKIWGQTMQAAKEIAKRRVESERVQREVVPNSLTAVMEAAKQP